MDIQKMQDDLVKIRAETMWVFEEVRKTNRVQRWLTPFVVTCTGLGLMALGVALSKL